MILFWEFIYSNSIHSIENINSNPYLDKIRNPPAFTRGRSVFYFLCLLRQSSGRLTNQERIRSKFAAKPIEYILFAHGSFVASLKNVGIGFLGIFIGNIVRGGVKPSGNIKSSFSKSEDGTEILISLISPIFNVSESESESELVSSSIFPGKVDRAMSVTSFNISGLNFPIAKSRAIRNSF